MKIKLFEQFINDGFSEGEIVMINPDNDNENYDDFRGKELVITNVARNKDEHPGYDDSMNGENLYDLETVDGEPVPFSLYDYELVSA
jgi:hypothetical protein